MLSKNFKFDLAVILLIAAIIGVDAQSSCTTVDQEPGACVPILTCELLTKKLNEAPRPLPASIRDYVQRSHCGTFNNVHHVCCPPNGITRGSAGEDTAQTVGSGSISRPSVDKSEADIQAGMNILAATRCGKSDADRVANGENANLSEYPWMALLVYDGVERSLDCGGSLITERYVLTAAHCIRVGNKKLVSVRLGEHDTNTEPDCIGSGKKRRCADPIQEIDIEEAVYHKDYNPAKFSDDIGLLRLVRNAVLKTSVKPICLPITEQSRSVSLPKMLIAGWGRIETGLKASVLQKATVPVKSNDFCQQIHKLVRVTDKQMCAGGANEIDTCKGDSGGPIFFSTKYRFGARYVQFGVVSAGSSLCGSNFPGIYTKVAAYLPWIAGNLSP